MEIQNENEIINKENDITIVLCDTTTNIVSELMELEDKQPFPTSPPPLTTTTTTTSFLTNSQPKSYHHGNNSIEWRLLYGRHSTSTTTINTQIIINNTNSSPEPIVNTPPVTRAFTEPQLRKKLPGQYLSSKEEIITLRFVTGTASIPLATKTNHGEDAYFVSSCGRGIGIADGVGGWSSIGVDAGKYSRKLMSNCLSIIRSLSSNNNNKTTTNDLNPLQILRNAYNGMGTTIGTTTACVITLNETNHFIKALNLGDSGFVLFRWSEIENGWIPIIHSKEQQHYFNCPRQMGTKTDDIPEHGDEYRISVHLGDVLVLGTDGVFDNIFDTEIGELLGKRLNPSVINEETCMGKMNELLTTIADDIASLAVSSSHDVIRQTPFSVGANRHGYNHHGGKQDDVTVLVSAIVRNSTHPMIIPSSPNVFFSSPSSMMMTPSNDDDDIKMMMKQCYPQQQQQKEEKLVPDLTLLPPLSSSSSSSSSDSLLMDEENKNHLQDLVITSSANITIPLA
jgi:protein phosphatase PTC7